MGLFLHRFRLVILVIIFAVNVLRPLNSRNVLYAIKPMTNHTAVAKYMSTNHSQSNETVPEILSGDTCHPAARRHEHDGVHADDGPFLFDSKHQSFILSAVAGGQLIGTLFALMVYDFCYLAPILGIAELWIGLLNLAAPLVARYVRRWRRPRES